MRCKYGNVWLTGVAWQEEMEDAPLRFTQSVEVFSLVEATDAVIETYGNRVVEIPVPVLLAKESKFDAADYLHGLREMLPASGALRFIEEVGESRLAITYASACFQNAIAIRRGDSIGVQYTFLVTAEPVTSVIYEPDEAIEALDGEPIESLDHELIEPL